MAGEISNISNKRVRKRAGLKYSHPCDGCSLRKVKCIGGFPCMRCEQHSIPCTKNRKLKKCGPKNLRPHTIEGLKVMVNSVESNSSVDYSSVDGSNHGVRQEKSPSTFEKTTQLSFIIDQLLPCLNLYQMWFYSVWPVVSSTQLISQLVDISKDENRVTMDENNASSYCLCCAIAATMAKLVSLLSPHRTSMKLPHDIDSEVFLQECLRVRALHDFHLSPTIDTLLTSFFLYTYYTVSKGGSSASVIYLREALSIAQIQGMHDESSYRNKSPAEIHRIRKVYYLLLVTERFMCIEGKYPVILDASIPYPSIEYEEHPSLLHGFITLVKVFAIPDKRFFDRMLLANQLNQTAFGGILQQAVPISTNWIIKVQNDLTNIQILHQTPINQKLNILLSKYWMKSLAWSICKKNNMLVHDPKPNREYFGFHYPVQIAKEFLKYTQHIPLFAFESNGPGASVKLIEIANGLIDVINVSKSDEAFNLLGAFIDLISSLENEITIPTPLYKNYTMSVNKKMMERFMDASLSKFNFHGNNYEGDMINSLSSDYFHVNEGNIQEPFPKFIKNYDVSKSDTNYYELSNTIEYFK